MWAALCVLFMQFASASEADARLKTNVSLGGLLLTGNLNQLQANFNGIMTYTEPKWGNDLIVNGYRIYMKPPESTDYVRIGDNLLISDLPNVYLSQKVYLVGLAHYSSSLLHQIDDRWLGGAGVGYTPVRSPQFLVRAAVGGFYEHTRYPSNVFNLDVAHSGNIRQVPRGGILSNGWYSRTNSPVTLRYVAWYFINPTDLQDRRHFLDVSTTVKIKKAIGVRIGMSYAGNSVVVKGVQTSDLRATVGLNFTSQRQ
ncbi:MAG: DUF481 domain-containing protein [Myxococcota bacterium]|nr:DUF481 domain-containing protein [Myxococcota bacterium]